MSKEVIVVEKEEVAVDVDEVVFEFAKSFLAFDNPRHNGSLTVEDFFTYKLSHVAGVELEEELARLDAFYEEVDHEEIEPLPGSHEALSQRTNRFNFNVLTARLPSHSEVTARWLDAKFVGVFSRVHHLGNWPAEGPDGPTKLEVCRAIGATLLIDDSVNHLTGCAETGVDGVLFGDYPWNQVDELPPGVVRCSDWSAVGEYLDARS